MAGTGQLPMATGTSQDGGQDGDICLQPRLCVPAAAATPWGTQLLQGGAQIHPSTHRDQTAPSRSPQHPGGTHTAPGKGTAKGTKRPFLKV